MPLRGGTLKDENVGAVRASADVRPAIVESLRYRR